MTQKEFQSAVNKGSVSGAYILHGEEEFVKGRILRQLISLIDEDFRAMNLNDFETADAYSIIQSCDTMPMFGERRLVIVRTLPEGESAAKLAEYMDDMPESTVLVFALQGKYEPKKAAKKQKAPQKDKTAPKVAADIFSLLDSRGRVIEIGVQSAQDLIKFTLVTVKNNGCAIDPATAKYLVDRVGTDAGELNGDIQKLTDFVGSGGCIDKKAIDTCVGRNVEYVVFDILDYFLAGKAADGMRALDGIIKDGTDVMSVATYMEGRFKLMMEARKLMDEGVSRERAINLIGGHPFAAGKVYDAAKKYKFDRLCEITRELASIAYYKASGAMNERTALEQIIARWML